MNFPHTRRDLVRVIGGWLSAGLYCVKSQGAESTTQPAETGPHAIFQYDQPPRTLPHDSPRITTFVYDSSGRRTRVVAPAGDPVAPSLIEVGPSEAAATTESEQGIFGFFVDNSIFGISMRGSLQRSSRGDGEVEYA